MTRRGRHRSGRVVSTGTLRRSVLLAVPVVLAVLLGGLVGTGGTNALWTDAATAGGGSVVRSGTASVFVSPLTAMNTAVLGPGSSTIGTFTVRNDGTVPLSMRVAVTATKVSYADTSTPTAVLGELTMHLSAVGSAPDAVPGSGERPRAWLTSTPAPATTRSRGTSPPPRASRSCSTRTLRSRSRERSPTSR